MGMQMLGKRAGTLALSYALVCAALFTATNLPARGQLLIENVTVLPFKDGAQTEGQDVYVVGDRIIQIGSPITDQVAKDTMRIDGRGKYLIPGLIEMHGHIPPLDGDPSYLEEILFLFVARGVTTVRSMVGFPGHLEVKERVRSGMLFGPALYLASPGFSNGNARNPQEAAAQIKKYKSEGWELLKIFPGLKREVYEAIVKYAAASKIDFGGHVPRAVGLNRVLASGIRTIEHLDGYIESLGGESLRLPDSDLRDAAARTRKAGVAVVPTMAVWETLLSIPSPDELGRYPELAYLPRALVETWRTQQQKSTTARLKDFVKATLGGRNVDIIAENRRRLLKIMDEEGVNILFGSDAPQRYSVPGFSILREMHAMAQAGLSNARILETATAAAGAYFAHRDRFGIIAAGARADMVLLAVNPLDGLEALAKPVGVVLRGKWIGAPEIEAKLKAIARRHQR
jgi:imidazolonepropionase-like amidohydrolase